MNASALATKMLEWEQKRLELDALEADIKAAVIELGKTQTVGNVRASYNKERKSYDYRGAAEGHMMVGDATVALFTTPKIDWRGICKHVGIEEVPFTQSSPSVTVKLLS
jgi:hypothetical protein